MMTDEQKAEFEKLSGPLIKWLNQNGHPHMSVLIDNSSAELVEGLMVHRTTEHILD